MTTAKRSTKIWLIGNPKCDLRYQLLNDAVMRYFLDIFKNQNDTAIDALKSTIEAVTEVWLKSGIPMKSSWLHSKQLRKIYVWWKKLNKKGGSVIITPKEIKEKKFVKV